MKRIIATIATALFLMGTASAQTFVAPAGDDWTRTPTTQRQSEFPKVNSKGEYWFRFRAPSTAKDVKINFAGKDYPAQQDAEGFWNVVMKPEKVGFLLYYLVIDGARYADPGAEMAFNNGWTATMEVPSPTDSYYEMRDVPHGEVREHYFYSNVDKTWRRAFVYTPPGYDNSLTTRYPVLYLQHGAGEMELEWVHTGYAARIADNLLADGKIVPMIIVMNNDFVYRPGDTRGRLAMAPNGTQNFEEMFIYEAIPDIDKYYRTIADPAHRAMAGLSLGGMLTNSVGLRHSDMFAYYGLFSGGSPVSEPETLRKDVVKLIFETCGSQEYPDRIKADSEKLNAMGIKAAYYVSPDTAHEWQTWRRSLHEFLPMLFK